MEDTSGSLRIAPIDDCVDLLKYHGTKLVLSIPRLGFQFYFVVGPRDCVDLRSLLDFFDLKYHGTKLVLSIPILGFEFYLVVGPRDCLDRQRSIHFG